MSLLKRRQRDYQQAGALNTLIRVWGFEDDHTFITKDGHLGVVFQLHGRDAECLDDEARRLYGHRFEAALKLLDPSYRVYQYLLKRPGATVAGRALFEVDIFLVLLYEGQPVPSSWKAAASPTKEITLKASAIARDRAQLHQMSEAFAGHLDELRPVRLPKAAAFRFFRRLLNTEDPGVTLHRDTHLDESLGDEEVAEYLGHIVIGRTPAHVLTMKEPPAFTFPAMLHDFYALPGTFIACLEWARIPVERQRRDLHLRLAHFGKQKHQEATTAEIGKASTEVQVHQHISGECSLTFVAYGPDAADVATRASSLMAMHDGAFMTERYHVLTAWTCILPGNAAWNYRRLELLETHVADLGFLFTINGGRQRDSDGRPPLTTFATQQQTARHFHLHVQDVGHTLVLGAIGSGKTFLLNHLVREGQALSASDGDLRSRARVSRSL